MIRELAPDESVLPLPDPARGFCTRRCWICLKRIARENAKLVIATDHGTIRVKRPAKIIGDRNTNTNLRYKMGPQPQL